MRGFKQLIPCIFVLFGLVGRPAMAQILLPEEIPFTGNIGLVKTKAGQLCVIQQVADKGDHINFSLSIKSNKTWVSIPTQFSLVPQVKGGIIEFKDIEFIKNRIYIGGNFKLYGSTTKNCLIHYDKTTKEWSGDFVFSGSNTPMIYALAGNIETLYLGGLFQKINNVEFDNVARVQSTKSFLAERILLNKNIGTGTSGYVNSLEYDTTSKIVYVGGTFQSFVGLSYKCIVGITPADTSKILESGKNSNFKAISTMRLLGSKLAVCAYSDSGMALYLMTPGATPIKIKGIDSITNWYNIRFFASSGIMYITGALKLAGESRTQGLYSFSESTPAVGAFRKFQKVSAGESLNNEIYLVGSFISTLTNSIDIFTFGKIVLEYQRFYGRVFADLNDDGKFNSNDIPISGRTVRVKAGSNFTTLIPLDKLGFFTFVYPFNTKPVIVYNITVESTASELALAGHYAFSNDTIKERLVDIPLKYKKSNFSDITLKMTAATGAKTRNDTSELYILTVSNRGLINVTVPKLKLDFDRVQDVTSIPAPIINPGNLTWKDLVLAPGEQKSFAIKLTVPSANYSTGQQVKFTTSLPGFTDDNAGNNTDSLLQTVTKGISPFVKLQDPDLNQGDSFAWLNASVGKVDYTIRFSNYANDTVTTVVVKDTISTPDYVTYIQETGSSHAFTRQVYTTPSLPDKLIVIYTFSNIKLPPNPTGNAEVSASSGFIGFRVGFSPVMIPGGSSLRNRASIYMDNANPVMTNMVIAKIPVSSVHHVSIQNKIQVYPNPFHDKLFLGVGAKGAIFTLFSLDGRTIFSNIFEAGSFDITPYKLANGTYFYRIDGANKPMGSGILIKN